MNTATYNREREQRLENPPRCRAKCMRMPAYACTCAYLRGAGGHDVPLAVVDLVQTQLLGDLHLHTHACT